MEAVCYSETFLPSYPPPESVIQDRTCHESSSPWNQNLMAVRLVRPAWDWVHLVRRPLFGLLYQPRMIDDESGEVGWMRTDRGNRSTQRKYAPVPLCPSQNPHDLTSNGTRAATMGSRRLTALAMVRPLYHLTC
jgi:hypothetical protein